MTAKRLPKRANVPALAKILDRSPKVVYEIIAAKGLKRDKRGTYDVAAVLSEHCERQKRNRRIPKAPDTPLSDPTNWSDKLKAKQVEKLQVQIDELRGELVRKDDVSDMLVATIEAMRGGLDNWVQRIAAEKRDADLLRWAESSRDQAVAMVREKIEAIEAR